MKNIVMAYREGGGVACKEFGVINYIQGNANMNFFMGTVGLGIWMLGYFLRFKCGRPP